MESAQWFEQSHKIMSAGGTMYVLYLLSLSVAYYVLYRKGTVPRVFDLAARGFMARSVRRPVEALSSGALALGVLLAPLVLGGVSFLLAARATNAYYRGVDPGWLDWAARIYPSWLETMLLAVLAFALYAALDAYAFWPAGGGRGSEGRVDNRFTRLLSSISSRLLPVTSEARRAWTWLAGTGLGAASIRLGQIVCGARRRAARSTPYRLLYHAVVICALFYGVQNLGSVLPFGRDRIEPVPDSARKASALSLAKEAGVEKVLFQIKRVSWRTTAMNAYGLNREFGARIRYTDTLWDGQDDEELISTTGHELFHVLHLNVYEYLALACLMLLAIPCLLIGPPKKDGVFDPLSRAPRCALILLLCWPAFEVGWNALQRPYEAQADVFSVRLTVPGRASLESARSSLIKVTRSSGLDPQPFWLFKHLFYSHPPLFERLRIIEEAAKKAPTETARE